MGVVVVPCLESCSWRPWQEVPKKKSQLLDLVLTFCLNLSIVFFKNRQHKKHQKKSLWRPAQIVIPLGNDKQVPAGDPSGVTQEAGLESILCTLQWVLKTLCLLQASWYSHIPNVPFAVCVAWCEAVNLSISNAPALAQPLAFVSTASWLKSKVSSSVFRLLRPLKQSNQKTSQTVTRNLPEVVGQFPFYLITLMFLCTPGRPLYWWLVLSTCSLSSGSSVTFDPSQLMSPRA